MNRVRGTIEYLRSALWFVPLIAIPLELVLSRLFHQIDARLDWTLLGLGPAGARAVLEVTVTMTLSFIVLNRLRSRNKTANGLPLIVSQSRSSSFIFSTK